LNIEYLRLGVPWSSTAGLKSGQFNHQETYAKNANIEYRIMNIDIRYSIFCGSLFGFAKYEAILT